MTTEPLDLRHHLLPPRSPTVLPVLHGELASTPCTMKTRLQTLHPSFLILHQMPLQWAIDDWIQSRLAQRDGSGDSDGTAAKSHLSSNRRAGVGSRVHGETSHHASASLMRNPMVSG